MSEQLTPIKLVNPITGKEVNEVIKEKEARERGYYEWEFVKKHLEDENEYVKYFKIGLHEVIVEVLKPLKQYDLKPMVNQERILEATCSIDDPECAACGS